MFETDLEIMKEHILSLRKYTKNMRILVVEDYEVLQKSLEKIFTSLILELFLSKLNQTLSNEEIINHLFLHGIDIELSNVRKVVYKLRKKLANDLIENIHSIGYKIK